MKKEFREGKIPLEIQDSLWDKPGEIPVGVVGLGLMGTSIATCLLAAGHPVLASERNAGMCHSARRRVFKFLTEVKREGLGGSEPERVVRRLKVGRGYSHLKGNKLVIECVPEKLHAKRGVIRSLVGIILSAAIIESIVSVWPGPCGRV
jgi:3-hydroxybutyryl-CoA dehydrogenase